MSVRNRSFLLKGGSDRGTLFLLFYFFWRPKGSMYWWPHWWVQVSTEVILLVVTMRCNYPIYSLWMVLLLLVKKANRMCIPCRLCYFFFRTSWGWRLILIKVCWYVLMCLKLGCQKRHQWWIVEPVLYLLLTWGCLLVGMSGSEVFGNLWLIVLLLGCCHGIINFIIWWVSYPNFWPKTALTHVI